MVLCGINPGFPGLSPNRRQVAYALRTRAPLTWEPKPPDPFDLHVLGLPLAFILSQDQTLHCKKLAAVRRLQMCPFDPGFPFNLTQPSLRGSPYPFVCFSVSTISQRTCRRTTFFACRLAACVSLTPPQSRSLFCGVQSSEVSFKPPKLFSIFFFSLFASKLPSGAGCKGKKTFSTCSNLFPSFFSGPLASGSAARPLFRTGMQR